MGTGSRRAKRCLRRWIFSLRLGQTILTRSPFESQVDLQASYAFRLGGARQLTLVADIFNLFNERRIIDYDQWTELNGM